MDILLAGSPRLPYAKGLKVSDSDSHQQLLALIAEYASKPKMGFDKKAKSLFDYVASLSDSELDLLVSKSGFIPEFYEHDSSEEKVYAKAMDVIVASSLSRFGYNSEISEERSNAADVTAEGEDGHTVVLDAKAFRLSRTALNPKDYKIEALNTWRKGADFACLVGPLAGFPDGNSRLFAEALRYNVTLITFSHLQFALNRTLTGTHLWRPIWDASPTVLQIAGDSPVATTYWAALDSIFCAQMGVQVEEWAVARRAYFEGMLSVADEQIAYFEEEVQTIKGMSRELLVELALSARKLQSKQAVIEAKKKKAIALLKAVEGQET